jgi:DNA-binding NtrC family response regulator
MRHSVEGTIAGHDSSRMKSNQRPVEKGLVVAFDRPRILVADDDPLTSELLETRYHVVSVKDGREAFRLLSRDADFSVAIFNLTMPHLCGVDLVRYMKTEKRLIRIPVIIVSTDGGIKTVGDAFAAGALASLAKPFGAGHLQQVLRLALNHSRTQRKFSPAA